MKRPTLATRYANANKAQENPYGIQIAGLLFVIVVVLSASNAFGRTMNQPTFQIIDAHARACPAAVKTNIDAIALYLAKAAHTDMEKARAIYVWLTDNITYDANGFNYGNYGENTPEEVLRTRTAVCAGFADLYTALGLRLGLQIKTVIGYAKGFGYNPGDGFYDSNHAWNAIFIDGKWRIFDATWGQGYGQPGKYGELVHTKAFNPDWFDIEPEYAIFTHFPEKPTETYLKVKLSLSEYEQLPRYTPRELYMNNLKPYELIGVVKSTVKKS